MFEDKHVDPSNNCKVKVKWSRHRSGVAQTLGRGIALLFYDLGTRKGWVVINVHKEISGFRQICTEGLKSCGVLNGVGR